MKTTTTLAALALATAATAQVFDPPRPANERYRRPNEVGFWFTALDWDVPGDPLRTGGVITGEFSIGRTMSLGFWAGRDEDQEAPFSPDQSWFGAHFAYIFQQTPESVLGARIGFLTVEPEGFERANWTTLDLVGSSRLDREGKWWLGYTVGVLGGEESGGGSFVASDGTSYGLSLAHRLSETWSLGAAWWTMDLDNGTIVRRTSLGGSLRF